MLVAILFLHEKRVPKKEASNTHTHMHTHTAKRRKVSMMLFEPTDSTEVVPPSGPLNL